MNEVFDQSPREIQLLNSDEEISIQSPSNNSSGPKKVQMKKELGLLEGVAIILGIIFGSGIFIIQIIFLINKNLKNFKYLNIFIHIAS
jgi:hypothetical protein